MSEVNQNLPASVVDNYKQIFRTGETAENGTVKLISVDQAQNTVCSMMFMDGLEELDADRLCSFYPLCNDEDEEIQEILLPFSVVQDLGIVIVQNLEHCVRGDKWYPDWLSGSSVWGALGRLCYGVELASKAGLNVDELTRSEVYAAVSNAVIYLNMTDAAVKAIRGEKIALENTAKALIMLLFDLLNGQRAAQTPSEQEIDALPVMYPHSDRLKELFKSALIAGEAIDLLQWGELFEECATEMNERLNVQVGDRDEEEPEEEPEAHEEEYLFFSEMGRGWQLNNNGDGEMTAVRTHPVYRLPENAWQAYDPVFEEITPAARRQFRILALPVDGIQRRDGQYSIYDDIALGAGVSWNVLSNAENGFSDALRLTAGLLKELERAESLGIVLRRLDRRQLIDQPDARVMLCGENVRDDADGKVFSAADAVQMLLGDLAKHPLVAPELKRLLTVNQKVPIDGCRWINLLQYAVDHPYTCPTCGKVYMSGVACPDCGGGQVRFKLKTDLGAPQEIFLPADGTPVICSELHPDMGDEAVMKIYVDAPEGFFKVENIGSFTWKYVRGSGTEELHPGQSTYLTAGMRIALVVRKLQLEYKGMEA
ncbi:MAG: hypothetical protein Q4E13_05525 [Clostridia bacterium]|nr:hypothetical protein [Clostridia bacterium]